MGMARKIHRRVVAAAKAVGISVSLTFSGTTKPAAFVDVGLGANAPTSTTMSGGILKENAPAAVDGTYYTITIWGDQMGTTFYSSEVTNGASGPSSDRGIGPGMANAAGTLALFAIVFANTTAARLFFWNGTTLTQVGTTQATFSSSGTDTLKLVPSLSAGVWTYTLWKNGVATTVAWTDSSAQFSPPPKYPCGAFRRIRSAGAAYPSPGIKAYAAVDL